MGLGSVGGVAQRSKWQETYFIAGKAVLHGQASTQTPRPITCLCTLGDGLCGSDGGGGQGVEDGFAHISWRLQCAFFMHAARTDIYSRLPVPSTHLQRSTETDRSSSHRQPSITTNLPSSAYLRLLCLFHHHDGCLHLRHLCLCLLCDSI